MTARPPRPSEPQWDNLPNLLTTRPIWVGWRYELIGERWTKVPLQPEGARASSTDSATWDPFEFSQCAYFSRRYDGVGIVLSEADPYTGFDFDKCRDPATGTVAPAILAYVERLSSYSEISPAGKGLRVLVSAPLPPANRRIGNIEVYDAGRFLSVTGNLLPSASRTINSRQEIVTAIHSEIFAERMALRQAHALQD